PVPLLPTMCVSAPTPTQISTLSLHDALPILPRGEQYAIITHQLCQLNTVSIGIGRRAVSQIIPIPSGKVNTERHIILMSSLHKFLYHISLPTLPWRLAYVIIRGLRWP